MTPGDTFQTPGYQKAARKSERRDIRGQCAAARSGSLLGRMEGSPLGNAATH